MAARRTGRLYPARSPEARALNVLGEKWTLLIIRALLDGPQRFGTLRRERVAPIGSQQLQIRLAGMEADGLLTKTRERGQPSSVTYELTADGRAAARVLESLAEWERTRELESPAG